MNRAWMTMTAIALTAFVFLPCSGMGQTSFGDQRVGTSSGSFLRIGLGARPASMAGAYVAICDDVTACAWNPAGLVFVKGSELAINYVSLPADISYSQICYATDVKMLDGTLALQFGALSTDLVETSEYHPYGTGRDFSFRDWLFGLSVAKHFTDKFSGGFGIKYVREELGVEVGGPTTNALVLDAGTYYSIGPKNMRLAVALMNFGADMKPGGSYKKPASGNGTVSSYEGFAPSMEFKFGIAIEPVTRPWLDTVVDFELAHPSDNKETFRLGGEALFSKVLAVRAGHDFGADAMKTSLGMGAATSIRSVETQIDYSATLTEYLSTVHRISITIGLP